MVDNACPCCQPPTQILRGRSTEFIYVAGRETVTSTQYGVIWKVTNAGVLTRFYPATTGTADLNSRLIAHVDADRQGNIYFTVFNGSTSLNDVYCVDSLGVLKWSVQIATTTRKDIIGCAVSPDGHVYVTASSTGHIWKLDANTGTEITTGWPYQLTGASQMNAVCVDQSGNVYAGGARNSAVPGNTMVSLQPDGTVRWLVDLLGAGEPAAGAITDISINLDNTELAVSKSQSGGSRADFFEMDPATGAFTPHTTTQFSGCFCSEYSIAGVRYIGGQAGLVKNGGIFPSFYQPAGRTMQGMATSRTEDIYLVQTKSGSVTDEGIVRVDTTGTKVWGVNMTTANVPRWCVLGSGHFGAWGL